MQVIFISLLFLIRYERNKMIKRRDRQISAATNWMLPSPEIKHLFSLSSFFFWIKMSFLSKTLGKIVGGGGGGTQNNSNPTSSSSKQQNDAATHSYSNQTTTSSQATSQSTRSSLLNSNNNPVNYHPDAQLTLTHLRKLFYEYLHPKNPHLSESDRRDDKLYSILPLFIKVRYYIFT